LQEAGQPAFLVEQTLAEMAARADGCAGWSDALSAPTPATYGETPVLILNGQFDANTPPAYAELARSQLPNVQLVIIPNAGHSILGNHGNCPTQMVQQFLIAPGQALETDCTTEMQVQFQP